MDEVLWRRYALGWRAFELVAGWGIILAAVIGFAPAWSGPWSRGAIESWLGGIALCAVPVGSIASTGAWTAPGIRSMPRWWGSSVLR
jgi:hypothetical protein